MVHITLENMEGSLCRALLATCVLYKSTGCQCVWRINILRKTLSNATLVALMSLSFCLGKQCRPTSDCSLDLHCLQLPLHICTVNQLIVFKIQSDFSNLYRCPNFKDFNSLHSG